MVEEKVYELEDGTEMIMLGRIMFDSKRYLLLSERVSNDIYVACEQDGNLNFIEEDSEVYSQVFPLLFEKFNADLTN